MSSPMCSLLSVLVATTLVFTPLISTFEEPPLDMTKNLILPNFRMFSDIAHIFYHPNTGHPIPMQYSKEIPGTDLLTKGFGLIPCECHREEMYCACCVFVRIQRFSFERTACSNLSIQPAELELDLTIDYSGYTLANRSLSLRHPPPFCIPTPQIPALLSCVRVHDITVKNGIIEFCINFEIKVVAIPSPVFILEFTCVKYGPDGLILERPATYHNEHNTTQAQSSFNWGLLHSQLTGSTTENVLDIEVTPIEPNRTLERPYNSETAPHHHPSESQPARIPFIPSGVPDPHQNQHPSQKEPTQEPEDSTHKTGSSPDSGPPGISEQIPVDPPKKPTQPNEPVEPPKKIPHKPIEPLQGLLQPPSLQSEQSPESFPDSGQFPNLEVIPNLPNPNKEPEQFPNSGQFPNSPFPDLPNPNKELEQFPNSGQFPNSPFPDLPDPNKEPEQFSSSGQFPNSPFPDLPNPNKEPEQFLNSGQFPNSPFPDLPNPNKEPEQFSSSGQFPNSPFPDLPNPNKEPEQFPNSGQFPNSPFPSLPKPSSGQFPSLPKPSSGQFPSLPKPSSEQFSSSPKPSSGQFSSSPKPSSGQFSNLPNPSSGQFLNLPNPNKEPEKVEIVSLDLDNIKKRLGGYLTYNNRWI